MLPVRTKALRVRACERWGYSAGMRRVRKARLGLNVQEKNVRRTESSRSQYTATLAVGWYKILAQDEYEEQKQRQVRYILLRRQDGHSPRASPVASSSSAL